VLPFLVLSFGFKLLTSVNLFRTDNISHAPPPNSVSITAIPSASRQFCRRNGNSVSFTAIPAESRRFRQNHGNSGRITAIPAESRRFRQNHGDSGRIMIIQTAKPLKHAKKGFSSLFAIPANGKRGTLHPV